MLNDKILLFHDKVLTLSKKEKNPFSEICNASATGINYSREKEKKDDRLWAGLLVNWPDR